MWQKTEYRFDVAHVARSTHIKFSWFFITLFELPFIQFVFLNLSHMHLGLQNYDRKGD